MPKTNKAPNIEAIEKEWSQKSIKELLDDFRNFLDDLVDLRDGMDQRGTIKNILNNKRMRGANAWLLMCSIMVASLGLNLNSPAVIIGAMLISPLMSPILGIGLGFGINDRETLLNSLQHFFIAIIIALVTSYLFFSITPTELTDEIRSRTAPNLLDGLVAIFGGTAGVISTTRKDKSNAIPGVAIATALMPPLCVAGYGLAEGNLNFFLSAFYLFFLNSFFIAVSTFLVIRLLRFRYKEFLNPKEKRRNAIIMTVFSILILMPAILLLTTALKENREKRIIESFIETQFEDDDTAISDSDVNITDSITYVDIQLIGVPVNINKTDSCDKALDIILGKEVKIATYQNREIPFDEIQRLKTQVGGFQEGIAEKIDNLQKIQQERESEIDRLTRELDSLQNKVILADIFAQTKITYPLIEEIGLAKDLQQIHYEKTDSIATPKDVSILLLKWHRRKSLKTRITDQQKIAKVIKMQAKLDSLVVFAY